MTPSLFEAPALTAPALLESLARRGAVVSLAGAAGDRRLHVAPRDVLTDDDRANLRRYKPALLALLLEAPEVAATGAHRWASATGDDPAAQAPDARELARQIEAARRGQWLTPTPGLLAIWREFEAWHGRSIQSHELATLASSHADEVTP